MNASGIPPNFIRKWQTHSPRASKGNARRPATACRACRTAKTKCDGGQKCERCKHRDLACLYATMASEAVTATESPLLLRSSNLLKERATRSESQAPAAAQSTSSGHATRPSSESTHTKEAGNSVGEPSLPVPGIAQVVHNAVTGWPADLMPPLQSEELQTMTEDGDYNIDLDFQLPNSTDWDHFFQPPPNLLRKYQEAPWTSDTTPTLISSGSTVTANPVSAPPAGPVVTCVNLGSSSAPKCPCRDELTVLLPRVNSALDEGKLDEVFKITRDVVQAGQNIVDCTSCEMGCTDLICMMTIFRQTDSCFEFIAKADIDSPITMSYGGLELPVHDPQLRAMLVVNLVAFTSTVLDAIGNKGHAMLSVVHPRNDLAITNIAYLDRSIRDFKEILDRVVESTGSLDLSQQRI